MTIAIPKASFGAAAQKAEVLISSDHFYPVTFIPAAEDGSHGDLIAISNSAFSGYTGKSYFVADPRVMEVIRSRNPKDGDDALAAIATKMSGQKFHYDHSWGTAYSTKYLEGARNAMGAIVKALDEKGLRYIPKSPEHGAVLWNKSKC